MSNWHTYYAFVDDSQDADHYAAKFTKLDPDWEWVVPDIGHRALLVCHAKWLDEQAMFSDFPGYVVDYSDNGDLKLVKGPPPIISPRSLVADARADRLAQEYRAELVRQVRAFADAIERGDDIVAWRDMLQMGMGIEGR